MPRLTATRLWGSSWNRTETKSRRLVARAPSHLPSMDHDSPRYLAKRRVVRKNMMNQLK